MKTPPLTLLVAFGLGVAAVIRSFYDPVPPPEVLEGMGLIVMLLSLLCWSVLLRLERSPEKRMLQQLLQDLEQTRKNDPFTTVHQFISRHQYAYDQQHDIKPISGPPANQ